MELESCQNPAHTQNVFCSRITIHTPTKRVLLTHNDSHTRSVWFANTKHHSQTNAFCFRNKYSMFSTKYKKKSYKYTKQFYKYGTLKAARGSAKRKISAKSHVTNKCPVIHTTQQQVANRTDSIRFPCGLALLPRHSRASQWPSWLSIESTHGWPASNKDFGEKKRSSWRP